VLTNISVEIILSLHMYKILTYCAGGVSLDFQMIKGSVSLMLLGLLSTSDMYGYQMIGEISTRSGDVLLFKEGTLYPVLHELEKQLLIESYWENTNLKRKRKYYHITEKGREKFTEKRNDWDNVIWAVGSVLDSLEKE